LTPDFSERNIFWYAGQLILRKIIKVAATSCQILRPKCTRYNFSWGSTPDPTGGAYSAPPGPLAGFKGAFSKYGPHDFEPPVKKQCLCA